VVGKFSAGVVDASYSPVLFDVGERIVKYDALTGAVLVDEPGVPGAMSGFFGMGFIDYPYAYVKQHIGLDPTTGYYMVKLRIDGTATDISQRVVWNTTMDSFNNLQLTGDYVLRLYGDIVYNVEYPVFSHTGAFNATTGEILWHHPQELPYSIEAGCSVASLGYGNAYFAVANRHFVAYDLETGDVVWLSEETEYPWGNFWAYTSAVAYDMVYGFGYAGVYAFNASTGKIEWHYSTGDSGMETPYDTWPIHGLYHAVGDGKVYVGTCEHSPTLFYRGNQLHCIDAYTGTKVWSIMGYYTPSAVAEDTLFATNAFDSCIYAFAKGRTLTEVSVSKSTAAAGESVWISGRVLDQSPAQPGTPCVSKESMSAWLEYLHMQQPMPTDTTGVPVHLYACHSNGTAYEIGTVTSDGQGYFKCKWTPPNEDFYYVSANFMGDESYYSSWNTTTLAVGAAPQALHTIICRYNLSCGCNRYPRCLRRHLSQKTAKINSQTLSFSFILP
jgi:outer membrane protein assembly factor BamB